MLDALGLSSLDELIQRAVPASLQSPTPLALNDAVDEAQVLTRLEERAAANRVARSFIGMGYSDCHMPQVIQRNALENPGWYTAYTPYQPEIAQGRLEALLNFQTLITDLTAMDIANASLLDEATAAAEAVVLCQRVGKAPRRRLFVSRHCHPQTLAVVRTRAIPLGLTVEVGNEAQLLAAATDAEGDYLAALLQYPASTGEIPDLAPLVAALKDREVMTVVAADLLSLTLLKPPGEFGADVVVGSSQRFGLPMGFGGPHAAFFATRNAHRRALPGRLVGVSVDRHGAPAYRLALQTREQHIRREKATSNICTAQVLPAVLAGFYAVYHGGEGLTRIAQRIHRLTTLLAAGLEAMGYAVPNRTYFDTLTVTTGPHSQGILAKGHSQGLNLRSVDDATLGISLDETTTRADLAALWALFQTDRRPLPQIAELDRAAADRLPTAYRRQSPFLEHPVFHRYRSETEMMRYLRRLADKDLALDRAMIPLGSCTMKLNAAVEMIPISWPGFAKLHPFAPTEQTQGYQILVAELKEWLGAITGLPAVSLQPNSGAQGEYAGLLTIRAYHDSRGEQRRRVCLIPSSAHGTNPASAILAGFQVVIVRCDAQGNVDVADLTAKAEQHRETLAALMVTYPSTHGVFEEAIADICATIHRAGGQVYLDGANLNALVGLCQPAHLGVDVCHLNLHKTFCIPHGGGGPGVGPIACAPHLAAFLPGEGTGPVAAAPVGSASILPISWSYMALMGGKGLSEATQVAILNANYVAHHLSPHYPILYKGPNSLVAHECIIDLRGFKTSAGISVDDVAKRLMDYGFHAPTMSWPVAGTLMIEPTESEDQPELDRFIEAMVAIRQEIRAIEEGRLPRDDNPLVNAPHTAAALADGQWSHPYSRRQAAYPTAFQEFDKYWPPVGRVDNVYGDRNLTCSCPPLASYEARPEVG